MLFNSLAFALFLPLVFVAYWLIRSMTWQNRLLLVASYIFYGWWDWRYLFLIIGCSLVNYFAGLFIAQSTSKVQRRMWLVLCCVVCLGTLGLFKYYNFFMESFIALFNLIGIHWSPHTLRLLLPVGISFFTFQALSYTIDVYFGKLQPTRNVVDFLVFIAFFPQLVAGPIERATNLLPQFQKPRTFDLEAAKHGLCLMAYGLFKKMVVADVLSVYVDRAFTNCGFYGSTTSLIALFFFSIQIYCDFSGYSDVARGVAKLFGFELMVNFDRPYLSQSITEFWRRWHISLSTWLKDYIYIPLGGSRCSSLKLLRNIWIVFLISGLWHGASWTFVVWGALHALYQTIAWARRKFIKRTFTGPLATVGSILLVNVAVIFAWLFFRADSFGQVVQYLGSICEGQWFVSFADLRTGLGPMYFASAVGAVLALALSYLAPRDCHFKSDLGKFLFCTACILVVIFLGAPTEGMFIYFQF